MIWENAIIKAYLGRNRDVIEATGHLQCECAELAELFLKQKWYNKQFTNEELLSEAGDILNFLTYILQSKGLNLSQAMDNNLQKLRERSWI